MTPRSNHLLATLPESEYSLLVKHMELVSLKKGHILFEVGQVPELVYYPITAIISMMNDMADGFSVETYMIGNSGMVGIGALGKPSFYRAHVRHTGLAYRMNAATLIQKREHCMAYQHSEMFALNRMLMQLSQTIACVKHHAIEMQLIRWMLITLDRTAAPAIPSTHQEIADILGFRREAITLALQKLSDGGHVSTSRGRIQVLDRDALETMVCDCYWIGQQRRKFTSWVSSET